MTMITPSYLGETIEYSSLHACRSTLEDPTVQAHRLYELLGKSVDRGRAIYLELIQNAQLSSASLPKQQDFRRKRKLKQPDSRSCEKPPRICHVGLLEKPHT